MSESEENQMMSSWMWLSELSGLGELKSTSGEEIIVAKRASSWLSVDPLFCHL